MNKLSKKQWILSIMTLSAISFAAASWIKKGLPGGLENFAWSLVFIALLYWGMSDD